MRDAHSGLNALSFGAHEYEAGYQKGLRAARSRLPWRKVSEEPERGKFVVEFIPRNRIEVREWHSTAKFFLATTHWCYLDELKPEDTE